MGLTIVVISLMNAQTDGNMEAGTANKHEQPIHCDRWSGTNDKLCLKLLPDITGSLLPIGLEPGTSVMIKLPLLFIFPWSIWLVLTPEVKKIPRAHDIGFFPSVYSFGCVARGIFFKV